MIVAISPVPYDIRVGGIPRRFCDREERAAMRNAAWTSWIWNCAMVVEFAFEWTDPLLYYILGPLHDVTLAK